MKPGAVHTNDRGDKARYVVGVAPARRHRGRDRVEVAYLVATKSLGVWVVDASEPVQRCTLGSFLHSARNVEDGRTVYRVCMAVDNAHGDIDLHEGLDGFEVDSGSWRSAAWICRC